MTFLFVQASEAATVFVNEIPFMLIFYQFSPFNHRESMKHVSSQPLSLPPPADLADLPGRPDFSDQSTQFVP
jgi:hypothetical protein